MRSETANQARKKSVRANAGPKVEKVKVEVKAFGLSEGTSEMSDFILNWKSGLKLGSYAETSERRGPVVREIALKFNYTSEKKARESIPTRVTRIKRA